MEVAIEEVAGSVVRPQPAPVQEKIVDFIGEDELFDLDAVFAKACDKVDGLREIDVAVIVAMDEKHGRLPGVHGGDR